MHGGKWTLKNLRLFLEGTRGVVQTDACFRDMEMIIYHACKAVQPVMISDKHCFEVQRCHSLCRRHCTPCGCVVGVGGVSVSVWRVCVSFVVLSRTNAGAPRAQMYGFDMMLDDTLKPWLLEVNACPSLAYSTESDRLMKHALINDTLDIVMPAFADSVMGMLEADGTPSACGGAGAVSGAGAGAGAGAASGGGGSGASGFGGSGGSGGVGAGGLGGGAVGAASTFGTGGGGGGVDEGRVRSRVGGYELLYDEAVDRDLAALDTRRPGGSRFKR